jgi:pimeloyl-ACP methyl ester carboxylesterase
MEERSRHGWPLSFFVKEANITNDSLVAEQRQLHSAARSTHRPAPATVILVHGLWTPATVFSLHAHWLQRRGYRTLRFGYPSVRATLAENAEGLQRLIAATSAADIHLVGHSLGGLVILEMLAQAPDPRLRRAVLLGTPLSGQLPRATIGCRAGNTGTARALDHAMAVASAWRHGQRATIGSGDRGTRRDALALAWVAWYPACRCPTTVWWPWRRRGCRAPSTLSPCRWRIRRCYASRHCAAQIAAFLENGRFLHDEQAACNWRLPLLLAALLTGCSHLGYYAQAISRHHDVMQAVKRDQRPHWQLGQRSPTQGATGGGAGHT